MLLALFALLNTPAVLALFNKFRLSTSAKFSKFAKFTKNSIQLFFTNNAQETRIAELVRNMENKYALLSNSHANLLEQVIKLEGEMYVLQSILKPNIDANKAANEAADKAYTGKRFASVLQNILDD